MIDPKLINVPMMLATLGIEAQQRGDQWWAPCPNHEEKEGSWTIRDRPGHSLNGAHHCFGCGFKGNGVALVAAVIGISYGSAADWIKEKHLLGEAVPRLHILVESKPLFSRGFQLPREVILEPFDRWPSPAKRYLESRFISPEQCNKWSLGYAMSGRLQGRIVLPVLNYAGQVRSYTGRTFINDPKRYLEPHSSEKADLSAIFGEVDWPEPQERETVVVTEGAINALAVERCSLGVSLAAIQGSDVTPLHLAKIATFKRVIILTDPDLAGERANEKFRQALSRHVPWVRAILPLGEDAASVDPEVLLQSLLQATDSLNPV